MSIRSNKRSTKSSTRREVRQVLSSLAETKYHEVVPAVAALTNAGLMTPLVALGSGSADNEREGNMIQLSNIELRGFIQKNPAGNSVCRFIIFYDSLNTGTAPLKGDLLEYGTVQSTYNVEAINSKRFTIVSDRTYFLDSESNGEYQTVSVSRKYKMKKIRYSGPLAADHGKNSLWLFMFTNGNGGFPNINLRMSYKDL